MTGRPCPIGQERCALGRWVRSLTVMDFQLDRPRVALVGPDPLARAGLRAALIAHHVEVASDSVHLEDEPDLRVDAIVWDDGPGGVTPLPRAPGAPLLALVADGERARVALASGARGALLRDGDGRRMAAALAAIDAGLIVVDEPFVEGLVDSPPADPVTDDWIDPLTARELEVLELMAEGLSNKEIGVELAISPHTAKFHVNTILGKLDAQTRTEAVVRAARTGLLSL